MNGDRWGCHRVLMSVAANIGRLVVLRAGNVERGSVFVSLSFRRHARIDNASDFTSITTLTEIPISPSENRGEAE